VRVMPCGIGGAPKGIWVDAEAAIADTEPARYGDKLLSEKYLTRKIGDFLTRFRKRDRVVITIRLSPASGTG